jgi:putative hydrolase of the HAD superfamily
VRYDAVIFDLFGTLVDDFSAQGHEQVISEMAALLQVSRADFAPLWNDETYLMRATGVFANAAANIRYICEALLHIQVSAERIAEAAQVRLDFTRRTLVPRPDTIPTLEQLKTWGYPLGLVSDCASEVPLLWSTTPFARLIDVPIFSCAVGLKKPQPQIYHLVCEQLGVAPERCLYIGDGSSEELSGAQQVGMRPVLIRNTPEDAYDAFRQDVDGWQGTTIATLKDVLAFVDPA